MTNSVWIKVGTLIKTGEDFLLALSSKAMVNDVIKGIIRYVMVSNIENQQRELVFLSPADLGFEDAVQRVDFFQRAQDYGYKLCDLEIVLQFILQRFTMIQEEEITLFAMEPIFSRDDNNYHLLGYHRFGPKPTVTSHYASKNQPLYHRRPWIFCK
jgi:hypothetical protein